MRKAKLHDYAGLEADVLLTSILYTRIPHSVAKINSLDARVKYLRKHIIQK